jgi:hypothetical protein
MIYHAIGRIFKIQNYNTTFLDISFKTERGKIGTGTIEKPCPIISDLYSLLNGNYRSLLIIRKITIKDRIG